ncbi:TrmH family RNA methyltransferase [Pararhizobium mangrovi]|uniref:RNA methyltransferase n=1 Tax=Pararhizobium mangrovi TaxID=2590452 RepID=A0A506TWF5_9HYPH|nr:RNA methyltransferase [Pararhizobium mangrovi]TPW26403.1 RNA methyltransferase [Pararhizobium mangrovi]
MNESPKPKDAHYARLRRAHRDAKRESTTSPGVRSASPPGANDGPVRLYGIHTVRAALDNPERRIARMLVTRNAMARLGLEDASAPSFPCEIVSPQDIARELGPDAIHQGVMIEADPLPVRRLDSLVDSPLVLVLDQITDPHNVGAIMRSAVAFDAGAIVTTMRHSPQESGVLAKSASGALEYIPYIQTKNLAEAITELATLGFLTIGLDSDEAEPLETVISGPRIALVMGAEGKGLRQKTRQTVDRLACLSMPGRIRSLNVSNAAAVAMYAVSRRPQ